MSDETPRLGLGLFEQGDPQWDHTDTVEAVDEYAIERGSFDQRPNSRLAYGGVSFEAVGEAVAVDGELREWRRSSPSS